MDYDHRMPLDKTCYVRLDGDAAFFNVECPHVLVSVSVCLSFSLYV